MYRSVPAGGLESARRACVHGWGQLLRHSHADTVALGHGLVSQHFLTYYYVTSRATNIYEKTNVGLAKTNMGLSKYLVGTQNIVLYV